tara:strand:+ start:28481 stop:30691 length:2211 start_codon:yes stop_codon:yes gene_type:complete
MTKRHTNEKTLDNIIHIAVPLSVRRSFDYLSSHKFLLPEIGARVKVPFGKNELIGIVLDRFKKSDVPKEKLKNILLIIDDKPIIARELLETLIWCSNYYHHPIGEVIKHALPSHIRKGKPAEPIIDVAWNITDLGKQSINKIRKNARNQIKAMNLFLMNDNVTDELIKNNNLAKKTINNLYEKKFIDKKILTHKKKITKIEEILPKLTFDQKNVINKIKSEKRSFNAFLLKGVTSSGKTEVYLRLIEEEIKKNKQSLLLVPEIGLTPQLISRLTNRFGKVLSIMHSGLSEMERYKSWLNACSSKSKVIVGTRSAIFAPLPELGLIIIDEEHDLSYKQQEGFRYSARDIAIFRAKKVNAKVILGSATPSFESLHNSNIGKYKLLNMPKRIGKAGKPKVMIIDQNKHASNNILSTPLVLAMQKHLKRNNQILLFLNRRGYAPILFCKECKKTEGCIRCDSNMTIHKSKEILICHHCGQNKRLNTICNKCNSNRIILGSGTQRVTEDLVNIFPKTRIIRLDRDSISKKGKIIEILEKIESGYAQIIVGTQMLTKGHDFPNLTMVGILNTDQGILGTDFRSNERLAQTLVQVSGRAGRRDIPGEVYIQTHFPEHPLISSLMNDNYEEFERESLARRRESRWPPFNYMIIFRAKSFDKHKLFSFLEKISKISKEKNLKVRILGPAPAMIERRFNKFHAQLLFQSEKRNLLHILIKELISEIEKFKKNGQIQWNIDVDPLEL